MRLKDSIGWIFMIAALLVGGFAYWLSQRYLSSQEQMLIDRAASAGGKMIEVVVATRDLVPGDVVSSKTMSLGRMPERHVSPRMIRVNGFKRVQGHVLQQRMTSGEPLLTEYIAGLLIEKFSDLLADGERAVSMEARAVDTHSGMVLPGDYVDLYVLVDAAPQLGASSSKPAKAIKPVIERVRVLAAGPALLRAPDQRYQPLSDDELDYSLITVGVPISEAERLILAREEGRMAYLLRNQRDEREEGRTRDTGAPTYRYISAALPLGANRPLVSLVVSDSGLPVVVHSQSGKAQEPAATPEPLPKER